MSSKRRPSCLRLITLAEDLSSSRFSCEVRVAQSLVLCVVCCGSLFVRFRLVIVLYVVLRFTSSDHLFGICRHFLWRQFKPNGK